MEPCSRGGGRIRLLSPCANSLFSFFPPFIFFCLFFCTNMFAALRSEAQESVTGSSATAPGASGAQRRPPLAPWRGGCGRAAWWRWVGPRHRYLRSSYGSSCGRGHVGRMGLKAALLPAGAHCSPATIITPCSTHHTGTQRAPPAPGAGHPHPDAVTERPV